MRAALTKRPLAGEAGFTLLEVIAAIAILCFGLLAVASLKMGQPNLHAYAAYGWQDTPGGRAIGELGYRRAF